MRNRTKDMSFLEFSKHDKDIYCEYLFCYEFQESLEYTCIRYRLKFNSLMIRFNPNRVFLCNDGVINYENSIIFDRIKGVTIESGELCDKISFICNPPVGATEDIKYILIAEKISK